MAQEIYTAVVVPTEALPMSSVNEPVTSRPLPTSTFQLVGQTTQDVVGGISKTPLMLGVITLNLVGVVAAVYFLNLLIAGQQKHAASLLDLQMSQMEKIISVHNREFDALIDMQKTLAAQLNAAPPLLPVPPPAAPTPTTRR